MRESQLGSTLNAKKCRHQGLGMQGSLLGLAIACDSWTATHGELIRNATKQATTNIVAIAHAIDSLKI